MAMRVTISGVKEIEALRRRLRGLADLSEIQDLITETIDEVFIPRVRRFLRLKGLVATGELSSSLRVAQRGNRFLVEMHEKGNALDDGLSPEYYRNVSVQQLAKSLVAYKSRFSTTKPEERRSRRAAQRGAFALAKAIKDGELDRRRVRRYKGWKEQAVDYALPAFEKAYRRALEELLRERLKD